MAKIKTEDFKRNGYYLVETYKKMPSFECHKFYMVLHADGIFISERLYDYGFSTDTRPPNTWGDVNITYLG